MIQAREFLRGELSDLTRRERKEARVYYRLLHGPDSLDAHLRRSLERGFDLRDHFKALYDAEVIPERREGRKTER